MSDTMASALVLTLPQMADLALSTPEVGTVNFTVLHALLHVIIQQLRLDTTHVEFTGVDSERLQSLLATKAGKPETPYSVTLTQYTVEGGLDEEKGKKDESQKEKKKDSRAGSVVLVESSRASSQFSMAMNKEYFEKLNKQILELQQKVEELTSLPGDSKLLEALQTDGKTPVLDMYQNLALSKRLDAAETMLTRMLTMLEEVAKGGMRTSITSGEMTDIQDRLQKLRGSVDKQSVPTKLGVLEEKVEALEAIVQGFGGDAIAAVKRSGLGIADKIESTKKSVSEEGKTKVSILEEGMTIDKVDFSKLSPKNGLEILKKFVTDLTNSVNEMQDIKKLLESDSDAPPPEVRVKHLEIKLQDTEEQINSLDNGFSRQVGALTNRLTDMEKEVGEILERLHIASGGKGADMLEGSVVSEIQEHVVTIQENMNNLTENVGQLMEAYKQGQHTHDVLTEQLELLKIIKADKEDLEDALADKADACAINRKVSYEQFDQACVDMTKNIEDALAKLCEQEKLWNGALTEIQTHVESKMDRGELNPLRNFINSKLKILQEKFKVLTALKKEQEAAGTKSKLLRNVNCISCDKDVVMHRDMDSSMFPKAPALPPTRSMGPYLAYELDQLRRQQKCISSSKNMNMFENALQAGKAAKSIDHLCNRYCGGSHTVTTPQQRVTRMGHFLEQWGPEIAPVQDTMVKGTDGKMYKGRDDEQLRALASEKPPTRQLDERPAVHISEAIKNQQGEGNELYKTAKTPPPTAEVQEKQERGSKVQLLPSKQSIKQSHMNLETGSRASVKAAFDDVARQSQKGSQMIAEHASSLQNARQSQMKKSNVKIELIEEGEEGD